MEQNQLRKTITALGLSPQVVAALLNVTPRAVSLWLNGDRSVPGPVEAYLNLFARLNPESQKAEIARVSLETRPMQDGMYIIEFAGPDGAGAGTLTLENGRVYGFDESRCTYDGTYTYDPTLGVVKVNVEVKMLAGVKSVLGYVQPFDWTLKVSTSFGQDLSKPIVVNTDLGAITAKITFVRSLPVAA
jgi:hypothetical protein